MSAYMDTKIGTPDAPLQDVRSRPQGVETDRTRYRAPGETKPVSLQQDSILLSNIRVMLTMAAEGAFDLRAGHEHSTCLERFDKLLDEQNSMLDTIADRNLKVDPGLLVGRARKTLNGFADAVQREFVRGVGPGIASDDFDAALLRVKDCAVAAGAASALLDLAGQQF